MSFQSPSRQIPRQSIDGMEAMFVKMWDPPTESPPTPDLIPATNPVPEVMAAAGLQNLPADPHTVERRLMHGSTIDSWDLRAGGLRFFLFSDSDNPATGGGTFPAPTTRLPRGVIFHGHTIAAGPPPHTIHWHGIEPTPANDGVGHCSMEIGNYTYQWQPNFTGTYFYHCHRNTVQHFEFGLYGLLLIEPPDAFFATQFDPAIAIGACRDGKHRVQANLNLIRGPGGTAPVDARSGQGFEGPLVPNPYPGFNAGNLTDLDPRAADPTLPDFLKFPVNPHAMTVPYDKEALWVFDDRDSEWSDLAPSPFATYPRHGGTPGVDDDYASNPGSQGFFGFNQFNADYWFVTGVPLPGAMLGRVDAAGNPGTGTADLPPGIVIPPGLNSGVSGSMVSIQAEVNQTVLLRVLNGAYNDTEVTFPVDVTIIAWDGRALGVSQFTQYNHAYHVPAGTTIHFSVARRFDALFRLSAPFNGFATVRFIDTRGESETGQDRVLFTGRIPIQVGSGIAGRIADGAGLPIRGATVTATGAASASGATDASGNYAITGLPDGAYTVTPSQLGFAFAPVNRAVNLTAGGVQGQDFVATQAAGTFTIGGSVLTARAEAAAVPGVQMTLVGPGVRQTFVTNPDGHFIFTGIPNGRYTVTPSLANFAFLPGSRRVIVAGANQTIGLFRARRTM